MLSKISSILLTAGLSVLVVSLYVHQPSYPLMYDIPLSKGFGGPHVAMIPSKQFADYLPYIGGVSAAIGLAEKLVSIFKWIFIRK